MIKYFPYWLDTSTPRHRSATELPQRVDAAVVGGGFTGLSAAIHLARKGASVALFEQSELGWGASGRNGGFCTSGASLGFGTLTKRYGIDTAIGLFQAYTDAVDLVESIVQQEQIDCHFSRWGRLVLAAKPGHCAYFEVENKALEKYMARQTRLLSRSELSSEIGSEAYFGGLLDTNDAGLHVGKYVRGLAAVADGLGVSLHERIKVNALTRSDGEHLVKTSSGTVRARQVLIATNGYTDGAIPYFQRRIVPVRAAVVVTERMPDLIAQRLMPTQRMAKDTSNLITFFRLTPDNRLLIGGRSAYSFSQERSDRASVGLYRTALAKIFPLLKDVQIEYAWSGLTGFTMDHVPHAGEHEGVYYAMGYCGHGVQMATYMGKQAAEMMDGKPDANPFRQFKFRPIPMYYGTPWFLPLSTAYYRIKDWLS